MHAGASLSLSVCASPGDHHVDRQPARHRHHAARALRPRAHRAQTRWQSRDVRERPAPRGRVGQRHHAVGCHRFRVRLCRVFRRRKGALGGWGVVMPDTYAYCPATQNPINLCISDDI